MKHDAPETFGLRKLLILIGRLLTAFAFDVLTVKPATSQPDSDGSCFKQRLGNGKCVGLIVKVKTQSECCARGGYYLNRILTQREYLNDHLIFESGTPNCVEACNEVQKPTCDSYFCPEGYFCRLVNGQPSCQCHPQCELTDYLFGPMCTSNLRRFENRCQLKKAYCDSPNQVFEIVPCPNTEQLFCSQVSRLTNRDQINLWLNRGATTWSGNRAQPAWLVRHQLATKKRAAVWFDRALTDQPQGATPYQMDPDLWKIIQTGERAGKLNADRHGLLCPEGEFCLIRQFDGRPMCTGLSGYQSKERPEREPCAEDAFATPKCGVDNRTYTSECELKLAGLESQLEIRIAYEGPCVAHATCHNVVCPRDGMICRPHHATGQPVCLDCATLPIDCNASFRNAAPADRTRGRKSRFGDPIWTEQTQTNGWPVVCGSNKRTYANTCFLHIVNCLSNHFVDLTSPLFCATPDTEQADEGFSKGA